MINPTKVIVTLSFLLLNFSLFAQTYSWQELRSFGINSYSENTIHSLTEDKSGHTIYAAIGKQVMRWRGGPVLKWEQLGSGANALNADGKIYSITIDPSKKIYAAGWFENQNGRCYVAQWNGTTWSELGGLNALNPSGPIYSVISDASGNIYAAGSFIGANGRYVAKWNGTSWSELGSGPNALMANDIINSLCTDASGNIYAAGNFTNNQGKKYVAKWNGTTWSELGSGINALNANASINSISTDALGNVFAAGTFTNAGNKCYVSKWNGSTWTELGIGADALNANGRVYKIEIDQYNQVFAGGDFTNSSGKNYLAKWNGTSWAELGSDASTALSQNPGTIYSIAIDLYGKYFCAGDFTNSWGYKYVAFLDPTAGSYWVEAAPTAVGNLTTYGSISAILTGKNDTVYVAGCFTNAAGQRYVAQWDGYGWGEVGAINNTGCIYSLAKDKFGNLYAGAGSGSGTTGYLYKWNGNTWTQAATLNGAIYAIATDTLGNVYAAGTFKNSIGKYYVAKWNGSVWNEVGSGANALNSDDYISELAVDNAANIYVGAYKYFGNHVVQWNGTTWTIISGEVNPPCSIIIDSAGIVYVAATSIKKWDGSTWHQISAEYGCGKLQIDNINGLMLATVFGNRSYVRRWSGSAWVQVGIDSLGSYAHISAFATDKMGSLYARQGYQYSSAYVGACYTGEIYKFIGSGNWSDPSNWLNNRIPPISLTGFNKIIIDPTGTCILNTPVEIPRYSKLIVAKGKTFIIQGNLKIDE